MHVAWPSRLTACAFSAVLLKAPIAELGRWMMEFSLAGGTFVASAAKSWQELQFSQYFLLHNAHQYLSCSALLCVLKSS
jgi:hypothetical protein